jgi:hypothetical protein
MPPQTGRQPPNRQGGFGLSGSSVQRRPSLRSHERAQTWMALPRGHIGPSWLVTT